MRLTNSNAQFPSSMCFDHDPTDAELTCLLKGPRSLGLSGFTVHETAGKFRVTPQRLPIIWIMASMVLGAAIVSGIFLFPISSGKAPFEAFLWIGLASIWLGVIPFWAVVLSIINHSIAQSDDFFRIDTTRRILELCREGRTLQADEVLAVTEVSRYFRYDRRWGEWMHTQQTGVLVRTADGGVELIALADGESRPRLADQLASIFKVPVRAITLNRSESRALNDC